MSWIWAGCVTSPSVSREIGARCESHADCAERCLAGAGPLYPDGFCSMSCDQDDDCPGGSVCADIDGGVCLFACERAEQCAFLGAGWACMRPSNEDEQEVSVCLGQ